MRKIWVVIRREFLERVRNKWFVIATVLGPVLMGAAIFLPAYFMLRSTGGKSIAVVDLTTGGFGERLTGVFESIPAISAVRVAVELEDLEQVSDSLASEVGARSLNGFLVLSDVTLEDGTVEYRGSNVSSQTDMATLRRIVQEVATTERLVRLGVDPEQVALARISVDMRTVNIRGGRVTEQSGEATFALAYAMWIILYMAIIIYGVQVMGAVVEEKSSRVVEVLVSSLKPFQLLAGKVIGVGSVGLFQLLIWAVAARLLLSQQEGIARVLGFEWSGEVFALPEVPVASLAVLLLYFVLGFFLYSTMFAAVGAMSNSEAEARQAQTPVVMLIVIPAFMAFSALNDPDGSLARTVSLVPFSSPIAMPMRWAAAAVPLADLAQSVAYLIGTALLVTWVAARIYRVGILMYGKRPSPKELLRWVMQS